ncbi:MAG: hypothetical protein ACYSWP_18600 [Planctomycetota bacterium]|jgi:hypothetical protein
MNTSEGKKVTKNPLRLFSSLAKIKLIICAVLLCLSFIIPMPSSSHNIPIDNYTNLDWAFGIVGAVLFLYLYRVKSRFAWYVIMVIMFVDILLYPFRAYDIYFNKQNSSVMYFFTIGVLLALTIYAIKQKSSYKEFLRSHL